MVTDREDLEDLLDIKQAAQFLNVSATSLRRWTNAGRLACFRVGRKRERRFRRADLLAFAEHQPAAAAAPARPVGGVTDTTSQHLCGLYASDLSRVHLAAAFLADGLEAGNVTYLAVEPEVRKQIVGQLERRRPSVHGDIEGGRLVFSAYAASVPAQCDYWKASFAATAGSHSLRVVGDVSGGLGQRLSRHEVLEYERSYDQLAQRFGVATLCLYDVRRLSGLEVLDVLKCHQDVFRHPVDRLFS